MTPGPGAAPALGRRDHPERDVPGDGRAGPAADRRARACVVTRRVAPHRQAAQAAPLAGACTTPRSTPPASTRATCCWSSSRRTSRAPSPRRAGRTGSGSGVTAPYKRVVAALVDEVEADADGDRRGEQRRPDRRRAARSASTRDAPGFRAGVELAMGRPLAGPSVVVAGAGGAAHAVVYACLARGRAAGDDRQPDRADGGGRSRRGSAASARVAVALDGAGVRAGARVRGPARSTRRPSAWSTRASRSTSTRLPAHATVFDLVYVPGGDAAARRGAGARPARGERLRDADPAGGDRVRALDRRRRHGRRDAGRRRAAPRRPDGPGLSRCDSRRSVDDGRLEAALIDGDPRPAARGLGSRRPSAAIAAGGSAALDRVAAWGDAQPADAWRPLDDVEFGPAIPDPGRDLHRSA